MLPPLKEILSWSGIYGATRQPYAPARHETLIAAMREAAAPPSQVADRSPWCDSQNVPHL